MLRSRRTPPRRGTVSFWVAVTLPVLIGVVAIGMDGGRMMDERQQTQAVADAAALAAAADLYERYRLNHGTDPAGAARDAALRVAAANGYANDGTASVVTVHIPPQSGPFAGEADHAEVVIESNLRAGFGRIFSQGTLPVRARAVARGRPKKIGLLVLRPAGAAALQTLGSGSLQVVNASITVNSTDPSAYVNKTGDIVRAESFEITGGYQTSGGGLVGTVHTGVPPTADPLRTFPPPDPADYPVRSPATLTVESQAVTLQPGVYRGGITLKGGAVVTLQPGVYILDGGGLAMAGNSQLIGARVMLYSTGGAAAGPIDLTGAGSVALTPPTDGVYEGVSIFQDRTLATPLSFGGNATFQVGGTVYAPAAAVHVSGSSNVAPLATGGGFIARELTVSGNGSLVVNPGGNHTRSPEVRLVD